MGKHNSANLIDRLVVSDGQISLTEIEKDFSYLSEELEQVICACRHLWNKNFSIFLTGSLATALRSKEFSDFRKTGDPSDIDLWIIIDGEQEETCVVLPYVREFQEAYKKLVSFDICCVNVPDKGYNMSIKLMPVYVAFRVLDFKKEELRVFRVKSLREVKCTDIFYGLKNIHTITVKESSTFGGFTWYWSTDSHVEGDFVLTDIHSCFLIGGFLVDDLSISQQRCRFLSIIRKKIKSVDFTNNKSIFTYFYKRFPLSAIKIFEGVKKDSSSEGTA